MPNFFQYLKTFACINNQNVDFYVSVNMGHAVREKGKTIPESLNQRIQIILSKTNNIINVFRRSRILEKRRDDLPYEINSNFSIL